MRPYSTDHQIIPAHDGDRGNFVHANQNTERAYLTYCWSTSPSKSLQLCCTSIAGRRVMSTACRGGKPTAFW